LRRGVIAPTASRQQRIPKREAPGNTSAIALHGGTPTRSDRIAREGLPGSETLERSALPTRPTTAVASRGMSVNVVPHRNPNPAVVSGLARANVRNNAVIDGTRMIRKR
jgi:hypothetical protein